MSDNFSLFRLQLLKLSYYFDFCLGTKLFVSIYVQKTFEVPELNHLGFLAAILYFFVTSENILLDSRLACVARRFSQSRREKRVTKRMLTQN